MNPVRLTCIGMILVGVSLLSGCVIVERRITTAERRLVLAVAMQGGERPTPTQWEALDAAITRVIGPKDRLIHDIARADEVIHLSFTPDPNNPVGGSALVLAVVPNNRTRNLEPWNSVVDPETNPRVFELAMEALGPR